MLRVLTSADSAIPEGWLCARITAAELWRSAAFTTSLGRMLVWLSVPGTFRRMRSGGHGVARGGDKVIGAINCTASLTPAPPRLALE